MGLIDDDKPGTRPPLAKRDGVQHDARGNAIWQWAVDTGKHAIDSTSRLLKRLEVPGLKLEDDAKPGSKSEAAKGAPPETGASARPARASGYDPYGGRSGAKTPAARPAAAASVRKPAATPPARPAFWQRLFRRR